MKFWWAGWIWGQIFLENHLPGVAPTLAADSEPSWPSLCHEFANKTIPLLLAPVSPDQSSMLWVGRLGAKTFHVRRQALFGWCFFPLQCVILAYNHTPTNKVIVHYWNEAGRLSRITKSFQWLVHDCIVWWGLTHHFSAAVAHFGPCISRPEFNALGGTSRRQDF